MTMVKELEIIRDECRQIAEEYNAGESCKSRQMATTHAEMKFSNIYETVAKLSGASQKTVERITNE